MASCGSKRRFDGPYLPDYLAPPLAFLTPILPSPTAFSNRNITMPADKPASQAKPKMPNSSPAKPSSGGPGIETVMVAGGAFVLFVLVPLALFSDRSEGTDRDETPSASSQPIEAAAALPSQQQATPPAVLFEYAKKCDRLIDFVDQGWQSGIHDTGIDRDKLAEWGEFIRAVNDRADELSAESERFGKVAERVYVGSIAGYAQTLALEMVSSKPEIDYPAYRAAVTQYVDERDAYLATIDRNDPSEFVDR